MPELSPRPPEGDHFVANEATASNVGGEIATGQRAVSTDAGHREHFAKRVKRKIDIRRFFSETPKRSLKPERGAKASAERRASDLRLLIKNPGAVDSSFIRVDEKK